MSNSNDNATKQKNLPSEKNVDSLPPKSKQWGFIQVDLEKALDTWRELEKSEAKLSPEEQQFQKIKIIICQLKEKLEQF